jgi:hypothetical protein
MSNDRSRTKGADMTDLNKLAADLDAVNDACPSSAIREAAALLRAAAVADVKDLMHIADRYAERYHDDRKRHTFETQHDMLVFRDGLETALRLAMPVWRDIADAPKDGTTMFVVRGFNITNENGHARNYTTDPYCVWPGSDGGWMRWPHSFPPTHYMPLPPQPTPCTCEACMPQGSPLEGMRMILCAICGNKRCPHATDHRKECTNSNEPGQPGSSYPPQPKGRP